MGSKHENGRQFGGVRPVGQLERTLREYEAPPAVQRRIARRAGCLIGHGITHEHIENVIQESMQVGGTGLPRWGDVEGRISNAVHRLYHGKRI